jgi:hypothetical protein
MLSVRKGRIGFCPGGIIHDPVRFRPERAGTYAKVTQ